MTDGADDRRLTEPLHLDRIHLRVAHERWMTFRYRRQESVDCLDRWWEEQCGACRVWLPLAGEFSDDYGACSNPAAEFDGQARFEHDGCDRHDAAPEWVTP